MPSSSLCAVANHAATVVRDVSNRTTATLSPSSSVRGNAEPCDFYRRTEQTLSFERISTRASIPYSRFGSFCGDGAVRLLLRQKSCSIGFSCKGSHFKSPIVAMSKDYYKALGISRTASKQDIKGAYRKLARQYHPDVSKQAGAEEKFKEISAAYEVLSDDNKRSIYDRYGEAGVKGGPAGDGSGFYAENPFDIFESIFGTSMESSTFRNSVHTMRTHGDDLRVDILLDFEEAIFGVERLMEVSHLETCTSCSGSGAKSSGSQKTCPTCGGQGQTMQTIRTKFGIFSQRSFRRPLCFPECEGSAKFSAGWDQFILGCFHQLYRCYFGDCCPDVQIPKGTQPGDVITMRHRGVPKLNKPTVRGDHFLTVQVTIPKQLSEVECKLVKQLADLQNTKSEFGASVYSTQPQRAPSNSDSHTSKGAAECEAAHAKSERRGIWGYLKKLAAGQQSRSDFGCLTLHLSSSQEHYLTTSNFSAPCFIRFFLLPALGFAVLFVVSNFLFMLRKRFSLKR
ncbi:hypothetical protein KP509_04G098500 [Ceratopteris richardii]|uniref:J domain-containing protein n=1 Tax=Ceratopteris richardii TaxID=49495 RepID=A0A8T2UZV7_CERRI|nr:hypothetical protein KP509_04G098500 [Ceratopteris richardii]